MGNSKIKEEFQEFIRELSTEICKEVLIEDIIKLNNQYNNNNQEFSTNTRELEMMLKEAQKNIKELFDSSTLDFNNVLTGANNLLKEHQKDLNEVVKKNSKDINSVIEVLKKTVEDIKHEEDKILGNSKAIDELTVNLIESNENVHNAMNSLENQNKAFIEKIVLENQKHNDKYMTEICEFNDAEREKFSQVIKVSAKENIETFFKSMNKNMTEYTKTVVNNVSEEVEKYSKILNQVVNNENVQNKLNTISKNNEMLVTKQTNIENVLKSHNDKISNALEIIEDNSKTLREDSRILKEDIKNSISHCEYVTIAELNKLSNKIIELNNKYETDKLELQEQIKKSNTINIGLAIITIIFIIIFL